MTKTFRQCCRLLVWVTVFLLSQSLSLTDAQVKKRASKPIRQTSAKAETNASKPQPVRKQAFNPGGLKRAKEFSYIHDGRFERLANMKMQVGLTIGTYLRVYSNQCYSALPPNKEEITYLVQNYETQMTTLLGGRGQIVGAYSTRVPTDQTVVRTGVYAAPELAAAYRIAINEIDLTISKRMLNAMANRQGLDYSDLIEFSVDLPSDMNTLITNHGCKGQALTTFSENLRRVIQAQPAIQVERGEPSFLERECAQKLPSIFPGVKASACKCLSAELKRSEILSRFDDLEDQFALDTFLLATFSKAGLADRVARCMR